MDYTTPGANPIKLTNQALSEMTLNGYAHIVIRMQTKAHDGFIRTGTYVGHLCSSDGTIASKIDGFVTWNDGGTQTTAITKLSIDSGVAGGIAAGSWGVCRKKSRS